MMDEERIATSPDEWCGYRTSEGKCRRHFAHTGNEHTAFPEAMPFYQELLRLRNENEAFREALEKCKQMHLLAQNLISDVAYGRETAALCSMHALNEYIDDNLLDVFEPDDAPGETPLKIVIDGRLDMDDAEIAEKLRATFPDRFAR